ncbi:MAG: SpoIIE family protein phosphatase [Pirellulales bacterium]
MQLELGDILVMLTDGLAEAANSSRQYWGIDNVLSTIHLYRGQPSNVIIARLEEAARAHCSPTPLGDDIAIILVKVTG